MQTIKYYFADDAKGSDTYTWTTDLTATEANEIKEAYANSMKKWDNIYYYSYDENGNRIANKIINVVEGTLTDHNLIIYPTHNKTFSAQTFYSDNNAPCLEMNDKQIGHFHYEHWWMEVNIDVLKEGYPSYNVYRERTGEHELGHVLGIFDVDEHCTYSSEMQHHEELLMGYGYGDRSTYARYKDIAGVAITRGFHTDADHVWMLRVNTDGTKDVICTLCNGVRYNITLTIDNNNNCYYENKPFNMYKSCVHHGGTNEEMLLVATDGIRDFFKCQYCRHIEEVEHVHSMSLLVSIEPGKHGYKCRDCGYVDEKTVEAHSYDYWIYLNSTTHVSECDCGARGTTTASHVYTFPDSDGWMTCIGCGYTKIFGSDSGLIIMSTTKVSSNGSRIISDGTIMLVDEDIEAYLDGTLVFYDKDNLPQTQ